MEYRINVADVQSFADFVSAFNAGMIDSIGGHWNGNLNAFNDYLFWPDDKAYRIVLVGWGHCAEVLKQTRAPAPLGQSMLEIIEKIFADNPHVTVIHA